MITTRTKLSVATSGYGRAFRFAISGFIVALVGISVLHVLTNWFLMWYLTASALAFFVALVISFLLQKIWAFKDKGNQPHLQMGLFFATSMLNLVLNTAFMYVLVDLFDVHHLVSQIFIMTGLAVMNYTIYRLYIFTTPASHTHNTL